MSVLRRALGREEKRLSPQALIEALPDGYGVPGHGWWGDGMVWNAASGPSSVTTESAMRLSAVFGCLRLLSEAISTLPMQTFTRKGGVRQPYYPVPTYLQFQPPQGSRITYLSQVMLSLLTDGNAFVATPRDPQGVPVDLIVLDPGLVTIEREKGKVQFCVSGFERPLGSLDVTHISGMMLPGAQNQLRGLSPIAYAREVIDAGRQAQTMGANIMRNHGVPPAVIEVPADSQGGTGESAQAKAKKLAQLFKETNGGENAGKVAVLTGGAALKTVAFNPEDLQWLDSKRFSVAEIARFYGVPPHLIADASNSTSWGSGLAEQNLAFGQFSLRPWIERIDDAHSRLLTTHGLERVFVKLNLDALLRASLADRYASYAVGITSKFLLPNEARRLEDLPPIEGGDEFPAAPAPPAPEPDDEPEPDPGGTP